MALEVRKDPRQQIRDFGTKALSKVTGMSENDLTRKRPSILQTIAGKMGVGSSTQAISTPKMATTTTATTTRKTAPKPVGGGVSGFKPFGK